MNTVDDNLNRGSFSREEEKYPRRQMVRDHWKSLDGPWKFAFDHNAEWYQPAHIPNWDLTINVPFSPECEASGINDQGFHRRCWYQRFFELKRKPGKRILLHFGAVDSIARVWINDQLLGSHEGGYTPFMFDITEHLSENGIQTITVCADDDPQDLTKPRGKQDWQLHPHGIWYPRTTGIWQTVWYEEVPEVHIECLRWTPLLERWEIGCEAFIAGHCDEDLHMQVCLEADSRVLVNDIYGVINNEIHRRIALSDPGIDDYRNELLWSPEKPTLIHATVTLLRNGEVIDCVKSYTALRSFSVNRGRFLLNGRPYYMRLVLDQGYWPETLMTPPSSLALKKDIELIKAAGFNGTRKHQKIEDPEYLYWADVLGLIVWEEMPSAYRFTHESVERFMREWMEVIDRDVNHPCIAVWVPFNESWGVPDVAEKAAHQSCVLAAYHLTKTMDPTRPVIGNDGWESVTTDILGIHDYDDQPDRLIKKYTDIPLSPELLDRYRPGGRMLTVPGHPLNGQPVMLTEFGGIICKEGATQGNWGYSAVQSTDDFRRKYELMLMTVHRIECFVGFCYTQFADTFQEANGLFTADRRPKFPLKAMMRATRGGDYSRGELISVPQPPPLPGVEEDTPNA